MKFSELRPGDILADEHAETICVCSSVGTDLKVICVSRGDFILADWTKEIETSIEKCGWTIVVGGGK